MGMKRIFAAAVLASAAFVATPAAASVTISSISGNPGFQTGQVIYTPGGIGGSASTTSANLYIGRIRLAGIDNSSMAAVTFDAYCIDIFNRLQNGTFDLQAFSLPDAVKQGQVETLLGYTATFIDNAATTAQKKTISAAIQMAVWEIVNEAGTAGYSLDKGLFQVGSSYGTVVSSGSRTLAQDYLDDLPNWATPTGYGFTMMTAINPANNQRQVFLAAVPEPSAWALMILGFGLVGGALRKNGRSRRRAAIALA